MKLQHFQAVVEIAERGSIRAAARHLNIAQSALTRSIAELERELGDMIFERRAKGVVLTAVGRAFLENSRVIVNQVRRTREEIEQIRGRTTGTVTAGLSIAAHLALLPHILKPFYARYPDVRLNIIEGSYPTLAASLRNGDVDFYIGPAGPGTVSADLSHEELFQGRRTILCRKGNPFVKATSLAELAQGAWISTSITSDAEDEIGVIFRNNGLSSPRIAVRSQSALTLMTCLANSDFLAMVPTQWTEFPLTRQALISIEVPEDLSAPPMALIKRIDLPLTPAAMYLLDLLRRTTAQFVRRELKLLP